MLYAILCNDKKNHLDLRLKTRPAHLEYLHGLGATLKFAGPFVDENNKANGSLLVVEAQSLEAAHEISENDPYAKVGLFAETIVRPWSWTIKNPEGA